LVEIFGFLVVDGTLSTAEGSIMIVVQGGRNFEVSDLAVL
jgi:hypothetical protein